MVLFEGRAEHRLFLRMLKATVQEFEWTCLSYCLMPNHFHLLVRPARPNLSAGMHYLATRYARHYNDRRERYGHVFQGRYASKLVTATSHLYATVRYIALNPVRAGLCTQPLDYPWSAHRSLVGLERPGVVAVAETLRLFGSSQAEAVAEYRACIDDAAANEAFARRLEEPRTACPPELADLARIVDEETLIRVGYLELGYSFAAIGRALGRDRSTVARRFARSQARGAPSGA